MRSQFSILVDGESVDLEALFPDWHPYDRLGVVVHERFGALGATHLIQLAIVAFYDVHPGRRAGKLRAGDPLAIYPEIYLFHIGAIHGNHCWLDVFPPRKEVLLQSDASLVLEAINDRAITRLAVPDIPPVPAAHAWKEPAAARDRIVSTFAYSETGRTQDADVEIQGREPVTEFNARKILDPDGPNGTNISPAERLDQNLRSVASASSPAGSAGLADAGPTLTEASVRRERLRADGAATETYRRIDLDEALQMLVPQAS